MTADNADPVAASLNDPLQRIRVVVGDITQPDPAWQVDTIINAANESLLGGGGVDGAIHQAAGPQLLKHNRTLNGCPTGLAKITPAFDLADRNIHHIIHTVGPVWPDSPADPADAYAMPGAPTGESAKLGYTLEDNLLASCYLNCLRLAEQHDCKVLAFPAISTGVYRFPKPRAARIALGHVIGHFAQRPAPPLPQQIFFICFNQSDADVYNEAIQSRTTWMTNRPRI